MHIVQLPVGDDEAELKEALYKLLDETRRNIEQGMTSSLIIVESDHVEQITCAACGWHSVTEIVGGLELAKDRLLRN